MCGFNRTEYQTWSYGRINLEKQQFIKFTVVNLLLYNPQIKRATQDKVIEQIKQQLCKIFNEAPRCLINRSVLYCYLLLIRINPL